jgi:riboflavin transporter FmnP
LNSKKIAAIAVFTAISIALVLSPAEFPSPFAPFLKYQIWEIPIVVSFLLFGAIVGFSTSIVNTLVLLVVYLGDLPSGPLYNLAVVSSMLLGIYIIQKFGSYFHRRTKVFVVLSTALGCALRVGVMSLANLVFLQYPYPIGYSMPAQAILGMLPVLALFNATLVLYTVPLGYAISKTVGFGKVSKWSKMNT